MNYYISITPAFNHYNAIKLISIAIVSEAGDELFLENLSKAKFRKAIAKFLSQSNDEPKFYSYFTAVQEVAFNTLDFPNYSFRDLNFLEDYISEKVNSDFSVNEDSNYPFPPPSNERLENAEWIKKLHEFLIEFELRQKLNQVRKNIGLD